MYLGNCCRAYNRYHNRTTITSTLVSRLSLSLNLPVFFSWFLWWLRQISRRPFGFHSIDFYWCVIIDYEDLNRFSRFKGWIWMRAAQPLQRRERAYPPAMNLCTDPRKYDQQALIVTTLIAICLSQNISPKSIVLRNLLAKV